MLESVLITGGTGSFGRAFVRRLLTTHPDTRVVVYSRDEVKQLDMRGELSSPNLRFFIGDVRDRDRLRRAMEGVDTVIHAAALKQIPVAEYNPFEAIKTNVLGAQHVIEASLDQGVQQVVALSTDKAAAPANLYGATKLCSDKLFVASNYFKGSRSVRFGVVRYGNVLGSRGSVVPLFLSMRRGGELKVTDPTMTRFSITLEQAVDLVFFALDDMMGGEIYVPRIPSYRVDALADAIAPDIPREIIGTRPGEKHHEVMITAAEAETTLEFDKHFVILPSVKLTGIEDFHLAKGGRPCPPGFEYSSDRNDTWLSVEELRQQIHDHVDASFEAAPSLGPNGATPKLVAGTNGTPPRAVSS